MTVSEKNNANNYRIDNSNTTKSKYFKYKTKIMVSRPVDNNTLDTEKIFE